MKDIIEFKVQSLTALREVYCSVTMQICYGWRHLPQTFQLLRSLQREFMNKNPMCFSPTTSLQASTGMLKRWVKKILRTSSLTLPRWDSAGNLWPWQVFTWMLWSVRSLPKTSKKPECLVLFSIFKEKRKKSMLTNCYIKNGLELISRIRKCNWLQTTKPVRLPTRKEEAQLRTNFTEKVRGNDLSR